MKTVNNPRQNPLFDPYDRVLTQKTRALLLAGWQGIFRYALLELMPVGTMGKRFSASMGRPTKELYSMAGLLVIKEFMDWTDEEALTAYRFHTDLHFALNLEPVAHDLSPRTLERYEKAFVEDELAVRVLHEVTAKLVDVCGIRIDEQRLDSTHIFSDMASFGRTRMMGAAVKRFLTQVKRSQPEAYGALPETVRERYAPGVNRLFGDAGKDAESRRLLRQQVAEDMYLLVRRFADDADHNNKDTYKALARVFEDQCGIEEERVVVKAKTGGDVVQNTSDMDATYDGHKGAGYQTQIGETCHEENEVQLITSVIAQTAVESDSAALPQVLDDLAGRELLPESLLADAAYGSDENVEAAAARGVEVVSPTKEGAREGDGGDAAAAYEALSLDDFVCDEENEIVLRCPAGVAPERSAHDPATGKTATVMPEEACGRCEFSGECPVRKSRGQYKIEHTARQRRLAARRREERTEAFRARYRKRGGIEGTNSGLKRRVGLARLRVRGKARVFHTILLKAAGWNLLRAAASSKIRDWVAKRASAGGFHGFSSLFGGIRRLYIDFRRAGADSFPYPAPPAAARPDGLRAAA